MNSMHVEAFDLNLLLAFDALWSERHVTRAARRVGLTQSALSHALRRLRAHFDDPLFQPSASGMLPTARAQQIAGPLAQALALVRGAVERAESFDPYRLRRTFTVSTTDYGQLVLLPQLLAKVAKAAPEVSLVVRPAPDRSPRELLSGAHDLTIAPFLPDAAEVRSELLFSDRFMCVLRAGHPEARRRLTLQRFVRLSHVLVSPQGTGEAAVDVALRALGLERRVTLRIPSFLMAPLVIAESDHVITLPKRVVRAMTHPRRVAVFKPPLSVPGFSMNQFWHPRNDQDPGHRWFRQLVAQVARAT
jgi:DNA-binding transcriptional LysR family regulator